MKIIFSSSVAILLLLTVFLGRGFAESAIGCHCFKVRSYNPAARFAADDYILATSFNSLIANRYNLPKRQIIMLKMNSGVAQMDLLISLRAARVAGIDFNELLDLRGQQQSWKEILLRPAISVAVSGDELLSLLQIGEPVKEVGPRIADFLLQSFYNVTQVMVEELRLAGLSEKEMALIFILAHHKGISPLVLTDQRLSKKRNFL